jgi:uncharacterized membrane protein SirB2
MDHAVQLYAGCAGISLAMLASAIRWRIKARARTLAEELRLERSVPTARDGLLLSALVIDIVNTDGPIMSNQSWLGELWVVIDEIVARHDLKKVATYLNTYMVAAPDYRIAEEALMATALTALDIRDAIQLFVLDRKISVNAKFGISADVIPTVGLGSTVALSQLWNSTMTLAENAAPNSIELSELAAKWLGTEFDIERLGERPVLHTRKSA